MQPWIFFSWVRKSAGTGIVNAPIAAVQHVLPGMLERGAGTIVNVASNAAFTPAPYFCHYTATKGALGNFSESLRMELKGSGVHVLTVYPGPVETPMADRNWEQLESTLSARLAPVGTPDDVGASLSAASWSKFLEIMTFSS